MGTSLLDSTAPTPHSLYWDPLNHLHLSSHECVTLFLTSGSLQMTFDPRPQRTGRQLSCSPKASTWHNKTGKWSSWDSFAQYKDRKPILLLGIPVVSKSYKYGHMHWNLVSHWFPSIHAGVLNSQFCLLELLRKNLILLYTMLYYITKYWKSTLTYFCINVYI